MIYDVYVGFRVSVCERVSQVLVADFLDCRHEGRLCKAKAEGAGLKGSIRGEGLARNGRVFL